MDNLHVRPRHGEQNRPQCTAKKSILNQNL